MACIAGRTWTGLLSIAELPVTTMTAEFELSATMVTTHWCQKLT
jgi:hypothetical protein